MADPKQQQMQQQAISSAMLASMSSHSNDSHHSPSATHNPHNEGGPGKHGINFSNVEFGGTPISLGEAASLDHTIRGGGVDSMMASINNNAWSRGNMIDLGKLSPVPDFTNELGDLKFETAHAGHLSPGEQLNAAKGAGILKGGEGQGH